MKLIILLSALLAVDVGYATPELRIINGRNARAAQFPWNVLIRSYNSTGGELRCGGAIISPNWVLTSAQCVYGFAAFNLRFGGVNESKTLISTKVEIHQDYVPSKLLNDIAIILLPQNLTFSTTISPISLPSQSDYNTTFVNFVGNVSGFGSTGDDLKYAPVRILSNSDCAKVYGTGVITNTTLCTVGFNVIGSGACTGDIGSPLVIRLNGTKQILAGIVSFTSARGCASSDPTGYTRISKYAKWLEF